MLTKKGIDLNVCAYCKTSLDEYSRTVDHLFPKSRGGKLSNSNKVPCCGDCNKMKANMSAPEFVKAISSLIYYENLKYKESISRLKKIKLNTEKIINDRRK